MYEATILSQPWCYSLWLAGLKAPTNSVPTMYLFMKFSLSPDVILCGWLGLKHRLTNYPKKKKWNKTDCDVLKNQNTQKVINESLYFF